MPRLGTVPVGDGERERDREMLMASFYWSRGVWAWPCGELSPLLLVGGSVSAGLGAGPGD